MRIATWNVERLKHKKDIDKILLEISSCNADILVLTETDTSLKPEYPYCFHTSFPITDNAVSYRKTENRVSIFSKHDCVARYDTFDEITAVCVELSTEKGNLIVYGTIMGIFGNREPSFKEDLVRQLDDIRKLSKSENNICVIGDYNLSFSDNYYFTHYGRDLVNATFLECGISILTQDQKECIDHIAISNEFFKGSEIFIKEWNLDKTLSDHKGIVAEI